MREFKTVADLLDALQEELELPSDSAVAKALKVGQTTYSAWRSGRAAPREQHALIIARTLKISPVLVLAIAAAERSASAESRRDWRLVVEHLARASLPAVAALALLSAGYTPRAEAEGPGVYVKSNRRRRSQEALQPA
jgi:hypothetical protein